MRRVGRRLPGSAARRHQRPLTMSGGRWRARVKPESSQGEGVWRMRIALPGAHAGNAEPVSSRPAAAGAVGDAAANDSAAAAALERLRAVWWYGLGGLWLLDAALQAQPSMFTATGMLGNVLLPASQGQPAWIAGPMGWGAEIWAAHATAWNATAVLIEALIGCFILLGRRWPPLGRIGLTLSIGWALIVWYFGEGLGGLFAGSPTYLAGAPGSAFLYALLAGALLLPATVWSSRRLLGGLRVVAGGFWVIGALFQTAPMYWTSLGLASVLQNVAMMPLPFGLTTLDEQLVAALAAAPIIWNAALCAVMLALGLALLLGHKGRAPYVLALAWFALLWVALLWVVFQGVGMVFSGMATDPNTPPLWALLLLPGWFAARASREQEPARPLRHAAAGARGACQGRL